MAIKKIKVLHVRGSNARPMWIMVMDDVEHVSAQGYTNYYPTYNSANGEMITNSAGAYPTGINTGATIGMSTHALEYKNKCYASTFQKVLNISDLAPGDKIVFDNGSYILCRLQSDPETPNPIATSYVDFGYYTKDNEEPFGSNSSFRVKCQFGLVYGTAGRYMFLADVFPWKCHTLTNYGYELYRCSIECRYESSLGVYVPTFMNRWQSSVMGNRALSIKFFDGITELDPDDPYPDDDSGGGDEPDPDGIPDNDDIPIPPLPDVDITDTGFITLYRPSLAQVKRLADYMWSDLFSLEGFKKLFADPMDCILGFNVLPVVVPAGEISSVTVGNISTGVNMTECASQWVEFDCGTVNIGTPYDTYLDYSPYTKYAIYLPYIGLQTLSADDVVGKPIHLVYHIDALSCSCVAYLLCGGSVLYQFAGSCGYSIPLTSDSFRNMVSAMINIATTVAGAVASGGMTAPLAVSGSASIAQNVMSLKPDVRRSGSVGSSAGLMGVQTPYLILEIPRICKPKDQQKYIGYPSFITDYVGNVGGYSEWESVILTGVPCTDEERASIEEILKGGVYNV